MNPFLKYAGGKSKEVPLIIKYKPTNIERYFEPFVGGGSVYFSLDIKNSFINDKSKDLSSLYALIKEQNQQLKSILFEFDQAWKSIESGHFPVNISFLNEQEIQKYNKYYEKALKRKEVTMQKIESDGVTLSDDNKKDFELTSRKTALYMLIRDYYNDKSLDNIFHIATFYFLREYCYSSMFRFSKTGKFNVPYGGMSYNRKYMTNKLNYIFSDEMKSYLANTVIDNDDFENFLNKFALTENDFIFLDPPYDSGFSTYDQNTFDKDEQIRLRNYLSKTKAKWMLIIKKTDFIFDLYKDFNIFEYDMNYLVSFKNRNDKDVKHLLITKLLQQIN